MTWPRVVLSAASLALAVLLILVIPGFAGTDWGDVGATLGSIGPPALLGMTALWLAGLWAYTYVLTAALPGLTRPRALVLHGMSTAVSNVLPFGGALGVAVTFGVTRTWGFTTRPVAVFALVTGVWNALFRFALPAVGLVGLIFAGRTAGPDVTVAAVTGALLIAATVAAGGVSLYREPGGQRLGVALDRLAASLPRRVRPAPSAASAALTRLRKATAEVVRARWHRLTLGMVCYIALQAALFAVCLIVTGAYPGIAEAIAAFAIGRMLTTVVITPSGTGITDAGTIATLIWFGVAPGPAAAATFLFTFWSYLVEIPWGGLCLGAWALTGSDRLDAASNTRARQP